jgi:hypothetical protein
VGVPSRNWDFSRHVRKTKLDREREKVPRIFPSLSSNGTQLEFADLGEAIQYVE